MYRIFKVALAASLLVCLGSCSFIRFERGPYAIRGLEVVYSEQEDTTFLSWRLRKDAKLSLVSFELWRDGGFVPIDLDEAPYASAPWKCTEDHWCFQYQVPGKYEWGDDVSPVRSIHVDEGVYAGPDESWEEVPVTIEIDPIALGHNTEIDAERWDWFDQNGVPLRRSFEWTMTEVTADSGCEEAGANWGRLEETITVDYGWTEAERGKCLAVRPDHRDREGTIVYQAFVPSAETVFEHQEYVPPREASPVAYGLLLDMEIVSEDRCSQIKDWLIEAIAGAFGRRGEHVRLGVYTPISSETGEPLSGCEQDPLQEYPLDLMIEEAKSVEAQYRPQNVRVVWVYVNNIELPPSDRIVTQLQQFAEDLLLETELGFYTWAIGSNAIMDLYPWDDTTGWRPIEDDTFRADIRSFAKRTLPFQTMLHTPETEVEISPPPRSEAPRYLKLCQTTPIPYDAVGILPGLPIYDANSPHAPWPSGEDSPYYTMTLEPQVLVPHKSYVRRNIDAVVEVCENFCDNPFRTRGGDEHDSWLRPGGNRPMEVCQWSE